MKQIIIRPNGSKRVVTINDQPSKTQQQFADQCDVNKIVAKYKTTGVFTHVTSKQGRYADFSEISDFHTMVNQVQRAQEAFMTLPAHIRQEFDNDPGKLLTFLQDPNNRDKAVELGLIDKKLEVLPAIPNDDLNDDKNAKKAPLKKASESKTTSAE